MRRVIGQVCAKTAFSWSKGHFGFSRARSWLFWERWKLFENFAQAFEEVSLSFWQNSMQILNSTLLITVNELIIRYSITSKHYCKQRKWAKFLKFNVNTQQTSRSTCVERVYSACFSFDIIANVPLLFGQTTYHRHNTFSFNGGGLLNYLVPSIGRVSISLNSKWWR